MTNSIKIIFEYFEKNTAYNGALHNTAYNTSNIWPHIDIYF